MFKLRVDRPLSKAEWKNIQSNLAAKGFQVRVDGVKGSETCTAIRLYQRQLGSAETGMLTPEQIPTLLDNAATQTAIRLVDEGVCGLPAGFHKRASFVEMDVVA
jgi:peptidoglycan hydrolase-like protein with peptidoglycan-binding domain